MALEQLFLTMGTHSVVEAKNQLPEVIDRALKGEGMVITRHGRPVVELKPIAPAPERITARDLDWPAQRRVGQRMLREDAAKLVRRMRDEPEW